MFSPLSTVLAGVDAADCRGPGPVRVGDDKGVGEAPGELVDGDRAVVGDDPCFYHSLAYGEGAGGRSGDLEVFKV